MARSERPSSLANGFPKRGTSGPTLADWLPVRTCACDNHDLSPFGEPQMAIIDAWVAPTAKSKLVRQQVELGPLGAEEVEVQVEHCGLCHSDISVRNNDWGFSQFPAVLGHEAVGRVVEVGSGAKGLRVGQRVGVGWAAG